MTLDDRLQLCWTILMVLGVGAGVPLVLAALAYFHGVVILWKLVFCRVCFIPSGSGIGQLCAGQSWSNLVCNGDFIGVSVSREPP